MSTDPNQTEQRMRYFLYEPRRVKKQKTLQAAQQVLLDFETLVQGYQKQDDLARLKAQLNQLKTLIDNAYNHQRSIEHRPYFKAPLNDKLQTVPSSSVTTMTVLIAKIYIEAKIQGLLDGGSPVSLIEFYQSERNELPSELQWMVAERSISLFFTSIALACLIALCISATSMSFPLLISLSSLMTVAAVAALFFESDFGNTFSNKVAVKTLGTFEDIGPVDPLNETLKSEVILETDENKRLPMQAYFISVNRRALYSQNPIRTPAPLNP